MYWFKIWWVAPSKSPIYSTYLKMHKRCEKVNNQDYKNYWFRWIKVCERRSWKNWFINFYNDMWLPKEWQSLDRIDNDWNYEPLNCKWSTRHQQCANKRNNKSVIWVYWNKEKRKRSASIRFNKKKYHLWYYDQFEDAVQARKKGEFNFWIKYDE